MCGFSQRDADGIESIDDPTQILAACRLVTLVFFEINAPRKFFDQPQHSDSPLSGKKLHSRPVDSNTKSS